jgi:gas vesicle protein
MNKNMILAGLAGGIVGVTTALLFTPKSGSQLIQKMYKPFAPLIRQAIPQIKKSSKKVKAATSSLDSHHPRTKAAKSHDAVKKPTAKRAPAKKRSSHASTETKNHHSSN